MNEIPAFDSFPDAAAAATAARDRGDVAAAAEIFRKMPELFPTKKAAYGFAAEGLRACGLWGDAIALLEAGLVQNPTSYGILVALADLYREMASFAKAAAYIQQILDRLPDDANAWAYMGAIRAADGSWAEAEAAYGRSLALDPMSADNALGHGDALFKTGRVADAVAAYRRALLIKPDTADILFKLGSALVHAQAAEEAEQILRRAIALGATNARAHVNLATALYQGGRLTEATDSVRQALALDDKLAPAYETLGSILLEQGQFAEAAVVLRQAEELEPTGVMTLTALAAAENALGNTSGAERVLQRIISIEPGNLEARHLLAAINGEPVRSVPAGYSQQLFDWYAPKFERLLEGVLQYTAPQDTAALLTEIKPDPAAFQALLDLGCGTGLIAQTLARHYAIPHKTGVDVSGKMIEVARAKKAYDELIHGDAAQVLAGRGGQFDLITAIDMFIYVGDLAPLMPLMAAALTAGGLLVYSIETMPEGKYKLRPTGRFGHSVKYVEDLGRAAGLTPVAARAVTLRLEKGAPVEGVIGVLRR